MLVDRVECTLYQGMHMYSQPGIAITHAETLASSTPLMLIYK